MKVGYFQTSPRFGDKKFNFEKVENLITNIKADLIVLPELFGTGYAFTSKEEAKQFAEDYNGETAQFLIRVAEMTGSVIIGGFIEKEGEKIYNAAMIVSSNGEIGSYRKIHQYLTLLTQEEAGQLNKVFLLLKIE